MAAAGKASQQVKPEYDPIYDDVPPDKDPSIMDDKEVIKQITGNLKKAAAIWNFVADKLYPVEADKQHDVIPELFRDVMAVFSGFVPVCLSVCVFCYFASVMFVKLYT